MKYILFSILIIGFSLLVIAANMIYDEKNKNDRLVQ